MSRYLLDRFLYEVDADPRMLADYRADPTGFVEAWERELAGMVTATESVGGQHFEDHERDALVQRDIEALYVMGVHPFLLFSWVRPMLIEELGGMPAAIAAYRAAIDGHGRPSWRT